MSESLRRLLGAHPLLYAITVLLSTYSCWRNKQVPIAFVIGGWMEMRSFLCRFAYTYILKCTFSLNMIMDPD